MKDAILNAAKGVILDGVRLGTASVVGDMIGRGTRKLLGLNKEEEKEAKTKVRNADTLKKFLDSDGDD